MARVNTKTLREAAEKVKNRDGWEYEPHDSLALPGKGIVRVNGKQAIFCLNGPVGGFHESGNIMTFIAAASPATVLALLDELEALKTERAVPEEMTDKTAYPLVQTSFIDAKYYALGWNACRAAVLHGQTSKLTFEQWLEQRHDKIDVDCGCVSTETLMHWMRVAYEAGNSPVTPDGWISYSERMPNEEDVLVYCSDTKEQMVGFHKGKGLFQFFYMNGVEGVCEPSHWMPLPEPPQEVS